MSYGLHLPDFVKVWINGTERTSYVTSYERTSSLCQRADTFTISFTKDLPRPDPYEAVEIEELYEGSSAYVIKGYLISINEDFQKSTYDCIGQDKTLLLDDYFIHYQLNATGQTVDYWISHIASLVGLSVKFDSYTTATVGETDAPTPLGMQTAGSALDQLERAGAYYIKYDGDIDKLRVFRYKIERPTISLSNDKTLSISETKSTEKTRNVVKVFGGWKYNVFTGKTTVAKGFAKVNLPEMLVDKTTVLTNPLLKRDSVCRLVASRVLAITGVVDDVYIIDTHGFYPNVKVGKYAYVNVSTSNMSFDGDTQITSITARIDESGAVTSFKIGDKCPRVSIVPPPDVVFAAGTGAGALISLDAGDTFEPFFEGLSGASMNSWSIASNKYNQLMLLTQGGVYKRPSIDIGTSWSKITNLDNVVLRNYESQAEIKASGLSLVKVEKESGKYNTFHIMGYHSYPVIPTGYGDRWWVLYTKNFGTTWDSMPLYTPNWSGVTTLPGALYTPAGVTTSTFLETAGSGITYSVIGYDLEGDLTQNVTALVGGGALDIIPPSALPLGTIHIGGWNKVTFPSNQYTYIGGVYNTNNGTAVTNAYYTGSIIGIQMVDTVSVPNDRDIAYHFGRSSLGTGHLFRTKGSASSGVFQHCENIFLSSTMHGTECLAVDYSSLNGDSKVRLAIPSVYVYNLTATKCLEESGSYVLVKVLFIEDDIGQLPGSGISTTEDNVYIGSTARGYGGLYGWTSHPTTTTAAWRGINNPSIPPPSRNLTTAVTENRTSNNTGTAAVLILGKGLYYGGEYSADEPELGNEHLRDIDEEKNVGLFVIKYDFSTKTISSINCYNWFLNYVPTYAQPSRATAVRSNLIVVELPDESSYWVVSDAGNIVGYFNKSDIEGSTLYGIRDIPYYGGDAFLYTTDSTSEDPPANNRCVRSDLSISDIFAPPPTSGLSIFKSHPDYGYFSHWKMFNNGRMFKAERASPETWYWAGYGLPGQSTNFNWQTWDFRTASGGAWMNG